MTTPEASRQRQARKKTHQILQDRKQLDDTQSKHIQQRIIKNNEIEWYFVMEIPEPPEGYLNQLRLIANVTFRNK